MMKRILIGVVALLLVAAIVGGGAYLWKNWKQSKESKTSQTEVKLPLPGGGDKKGEEVAGNLGLEPEGDAFSNNTSAQARTLAAKATPVPTKATPVAAKATPVPKKPAAETKTSSGERDFGELQGQSEDFGPVTGAVTPLPAQPTPRVEPQPAGTPRIEPVAASTPTPAGQFRPIVPMPTATPTIPVPTPAPGNYDVRTTQPVFASQLAAVRAAMKSLGVVLQEQSLGRQQFSAYRIAMGYFQTKEDAESWAQDNFRPRGIKYVVYPAEGMFSLQIGIFTQPENVEPAMREFYRKYEGGRLPIREEMTTLTKSAYQLSISQISKALAEKVWEKFSRLGIQAAISGI